MPPRYPPQPPRWTTRSYAAQTTDNLFVLALTNDTPNHLWFVVTYRNPSALPQWTRPPMPHRVHHNQYHLQDCQLYEQSEPGDTLVHTLAISLPLVTSQWWLVAMDSPDPNLANSFSPILSFSWTTFGGDDLGIARLNGDSWYAGDAIAPDTYLVVEDGDYSSPPPAPNSTPCLILLATLSLLTQVTAIDGAGLTWGQLAPTQTILDANTGDQEHLQIWAGQGSYDITIPVTATIPALQLTAYILLWPVLSPLPPLAPSQDTGNVDTLVTPPAAASRWLTLIGQNAYEDNGNRTVVPDPGSHNTDEGEDAVPGPAELDIAAYWWPGTVPDALVHQDGDVTETAATTIALPGPLPYLTDLSASWR